MTEFKEEHSAPWQVLAASAIMGMDLGATIDQKFLAGMIVCVACAVFGAFSCLVWRRVAHGPALSSKPQFKSSV